MGKKPRPIWSQIRPGVWTVSGRIPHIRLAARDVDNECPNCGTELDPMGACSWCDDRDTNA